MWRLYNVFIGQANDEDKKLIYAKLSENTINSSSDS